MKNKFKDFSDFLKRMYRVYNNPPSCVFCLKKINDPTYSPYCGDKCARERYDMNLRRVVDDSTLKGFDNCE